MTATQRPAASFIRRDVALSGWTMLDSSPNDSGILMPMLDNARLEPQLRPAQTKTGMSSS